MGGENSGPGENDGNGESSSSPSSSSGSSSSSSSDSDGDDAAAAGGDGPEADRHDAAAQQRPRSMRNTVDVPGGTLTLLEDGRFGAVLATCWTHTTTAVSCTRHRTLAKEFPIRECLRWLAKRKQFSTKAKHMAQEMNEKKVTTHPLPDDAKFEHWLVRCEEIREEKRTRGGAAASSSGSGLVPLAEPKAAPERIAKAKAAPKEIAKAKAAPKGTAKAKAAPKEMAKAKAGAGRRLVVPPPGPAGWGGGDWAAPKGKAQPKVAPKRRAPRQASGAPGEADGEEG